MAAKNNQLTPEQAVEFLVKAMKAAGADAASARADLSQSRDVSIRQGKVEHYEQARSFGVGFNAYVGKQKAGSSTNDLRQDTLQKMAEDAVRFARIIPADPYCGLADPADIVKNPPVIAMTDTAEPDMKALEAAARACEDAAFAVKGVTNSKGAAAAWGKTTIWVMASNGLQGCYEKTHHSLSVSVVAGHDQGMETDYDYSTATHAALLENPARIGKNAADRAIARVGATKMPSLTGPVVFDPRISPSLLGHFFAAISGSKVANGTTFLAGQLGQQVFPADITIVEDPHLPRRLGSLPFDGQGIATVKRNLIDKGMLTTWLLDLESARQLKLKSTGHASGLTNVCLLPGQLSPTDLIADIKQGFYVTSLMGNDVNLVNGNYSRSADGFWIENGKLTVPVSGMTIAGNLSDMLKNITAANDLKIKGSVDAPTLRVKQMTIAGL